MIDYLGLCGDAEGTLSTDSELLISLNKNITSNFIHQGLCRNVDIERDFGVSEDSVSRVLKKYEAKGKDGFFGADARHGKAYKIVGECRERIQSKLDKGQRMIVKSKIRMLGRIEVDFRNSNGEKLKP